MNEREGRTSRTRREAQKGATRGRGFGLLIIRIARGRRHGYGGARGWRRPQDVAGVVGATAGADAPRPMVQTSASS